MSLLPTVCVCDALKLFDVANDVKVVNLIKAFRHSAADVAPFQTIGWSVDRRCTGCGHPRAHCRFVRQAERIVREQVESCGLTCYDILWTFHKLEVTVTSAEGPGPVGEADYVDSDKLMRAIK